MAEATPRLYIPALGGLYSALSDYVQPILRIVLGCILFAHGSQKLFGWFGGAGPTANAALFDRLAYSPGIFWGNLVGGTEFIGGILLVFGLFTRFAALAIVIFMIVAIEFTSRTGGFFWTNRGSEFSILIGAAALFFLIRGAGPVSVDSQMRREL